MSESDLQKTLGKTKKNQKNQILRTMSESELQKT